jgi:hypothetical protein
VEVNDARDCGPVATDTIEIKDKTAMGCLAISIDNIEIGHVTTCYGESTGSLEISVSGGYGAPWKYSIDGGDTYWTGQSTFSDLPAGQYDIVVVDQENCSEQGPTVTINQPDPLIVEVFSTADITLAEDGSIVVTASGGTTPYTFTLQPDGTVQAFGTFTFAAGDSGTYTVEIDDANNCGPVSTDAIVIRDLTTGFEDLSVMGLKLFPNPTSGEITIEMPTKADEVMLEILNLTGQVVFNMKAHTSSGMLRETIDVSRLEKGMYMLRVDGQTLRSGIVVN